MSSRNRTAGHNWEREIVLRLKSIGFSYASTSRLESKARDDQKVDIINKDEYTNGRLPYNIQAKNVAGPVRYHDVLEEQSVIPGIINVVFHKQTKKQGSKFTKIGEYAILHLTDFLALIKERNERSNAGKQLVSKVKGRNRKGLLPETERAVEARISDLQGLSQT